MYSIHLFLNPEIRNCITKDQRLLPKDWLHVFTPCLFAYCLLALYLIKFSQILSVSAFGILVGKG